jgi:REP-associated tyrosine transposase
MARRLRMEYVGGIYHVMNRGDRRELIVRDEQDRERFLETLGEACRKTGWEVQAWCLMGNHFHLVVETPQANLVAGMKWFLGTYTSRFNRRHRVFGHLFSGRYKALIVDGGGSGYLRAVCEYVHLNPVRARLLNREQRLREYRWSSYGDYLKGPARRPEWLQTGRVLGEMGIPQDSAAGRRRFEWLMEQRRERAEPQTLKAIRRGWCFGEEAFRKELLEQMSRRIGQHHGGAERHETAEVAAEQLVAEELRKRKWADAELERRAKGDDEKVKIARRLRTETTMTLKWIAQRLKMGTGGHVAHCLRNGRR